MEPFYKTHIFCCTNERPEGHKRGSCKARGGEDLRNYLKARVKEAGIEGARVNSAGCLDRCELGPVVVVYPEGTWYRCRDKAEADTLVEALKAGTVAEGLRLSNGQTV